LQKFKCIINFDIYAVFYICLLILYIWEFFQRQRKLNLSANSGTVCIYLNGSMFFLLTTFLFVWSLEQCTCTLSLGFAATADGHSLDEGGVHQARLLLCTMVTIITQEDLQHFDVAISVIEQLHTASTATGCVASHNLCIKLTTGLKVSVSLIMHHPQPTGAQNSFWVSKSLSYLK